MTDGILCRNPAECEPQPCPRESPLRTLQRVFHVMITRETRGLLGDCSSSQPDSHLQQ